MTECNPLFTMDCLPFTKFTGAGAAHNYVFDFPYIDQESYEYDPPDTTASAYIEVWTTIAGTRNWSKQTTGWTMPDDTSITSTVDWTGKSVLIKRNSKICQLIVEFEPGSPVVTTGTTSNIRKDSLQKHYLLQELAAAILDLDCAATVTSSLAGNVYRWTGNGTTKNFSMNAAASQQSPTTEESGLVNGQVLVAIDSTHQQFDQFDLVDVSDITQVQFNSGDSAPYSGAKIEAMVIAGAVVPNVDIPDGSITCAKLANGAICSLAVFDLDDLATNKQLLGFYNAGAGVTLSVRTIDSTWISNFDTAVRTSRLDQMAAPTANVSMNTHKITNVVDPTGNQDAATKKYVDDQDDALSALVAARIKAGSTTLSGSTVNVISVGWDWDSVIVTVDYSTTLIGGTVPNSGSTVAIGGTAQPCSYPHSFQILAADAASYVTKQFREQSNGSYFWMFAFDIQKSGNSCNIRLTPNGNNQVTGSIKLMYTFTKNS